jgi:hypothetical protein
MKKYKVYCTLPVFATIMVEAENGESALQKAEQYMILVGTDRSVGTQYDNVVLEPTEGAIRVPGEFEPTAIEIHDQSDC